MATVKEAGETLDVSCSPLQTTTLPLTHTLGPFRVKVEPNMPVYGLWTD